MRDNNKGTLTNTFTIRAKVSYISYQISWTQKGDTTWTATHLTSPMYTITTLEISHFTRARAIHSNLVSAMKLDDVHLSKAVDSKVAKDGMSTG